VLKWAGLYLLADLIGGLINVFTGPALNGSVVAAAFFVCMIVFAVWRQRRRRLPQAEDVT
jgi:hypothetical protein